MMVGIFFKNSIYRFHWKFPFRLINSLLQFLITGKAFNFLGQIEDERMIVHCLESGSIGFESPLFPLPSQKISWAMEMYNPNVNPYRNDTQIVQNIYKKLAAFSAREISLKILGTFLPEARTCFCSTVAQCTSDFPDSCVSASYRLCSGGGVVEVDGTMQHVNHSV